MGCDKCIYEKAMDCTLCEFEGVKEVELDCRLCSKGSGGNSNVCISCRGYAMHTEKVCKKCKELTDTGFCELKGKCYKGNSFEEKIGEKTCNGCAYANGVNPAKCGTCCDFDAYTVILCNECANLYGYGQCDFAGDCRAGHKFKQKETIVEGQDELDTISKFLTKEQLLGYLVGNIVKYAKIEVNAERVLYYTKKWLEVHKHAT